MENGRYTATDSKKDKSYYEKAEKSIKMSLLYFALSIIASWVILFIAKGM